ncbi:hypothetical protein PPYR_01916 [Photinus pyralis]|uniref:Uncharacterized protein n=1 Tax=Photinus pyralis TaxID=7054 RepID=A0A5N4B5W2_PHOPY|nr:uncharacterized protein LOC116179384 [Photinus pyralis]KAB0804946.1 hypothetical protein PPYR_01916 [Photinus pyralis]
MHKIVVILIVAYTVYVLHPNQPLRQEEMEVTDECECGIFSTKTPKPYDIPILMKIIENRHNEDSLPNCAKICNKLLRESENTVPNVLCAILGEYDNRRVFLHARSYQFEPWTFTGLMTVRFCCYGYRPIGC